MLFRFRSKYWLAVSLLLAICLSSCRGVNRSSSPGSTERAGAGTASPRQHSTAADSTGPTNKGLLLFDPYEGIPRRSPDPSPPQMPAPGIEPVPSAATRPPAIPLPAAPSLQTGNSFFGSAPPAWYDSESAGRRSHQDLVAEPLEAHRRFVPQKPAPPGIFKPLGGRVRRLLDPVTNRF